MEQFPLSCSTQECSSPIGMNQFLMPEVQQPSVIAESGGRLKPPQNNMFVALPEDGLTP